MFEKQKGEPRGASPWEKGEAMEQKRTRELVGEIEAANNRILQDLAAEKAEVPTEHAGEPSREGRKESPPWIVKDGDPVANEAFRREVFEGLRDAIYKIANQVGARYPIIEGDEIIVSMPPGADEAPIRENMEEVVSYANDLLASNTEDFHFDVRAIPSEQIRAIAVRMVRHNRK